MYDADPIVNKLCKELSITPDEVRAMLLSKGGKVPINAPKPKVESAWADFLDDGDELPASTSAPQSSAQSSAQTSAQPKVAAPKVQQTVELLSYINTPAAPRATYAKGGLLLQTGTLDWNIVGRARRSLDEQKPLDLKTPTVIPVPYPLKATRQIALVATQCTSVHSIAIGAGGECYAWGRNESGQLGDSNPTTRMCPQLVTEGGWGKKRIVDAAVGKHHTVLIDDAGYGWGAGMSKMGQTGVNLFQDTVTSFKKCVVEKVSEVG